MKLAFVDGTNRNIESKVFNDANDSLIYTFDSKIIAEEFASKFPKYCKAKVSGVTFHSECFSKSWYLDAVRLEFSPSTNKVTGDVNEASIKRKTKIFEILGKLVK